MPRPRKFRKVCCMPQSTLFGPINTPYSESDIIVMSVEEYETIRLIDFEGMMQEECAESMNVARTTVQRIYNDARKKLAEYLVCGKVLRIQGGDFQICGENHGQHCSHCNGRYGRRG